MLFFSWFLQLRLLSLNLRALILQYEFVYGLVLRCQEASLALPIPCSVRCGYILLETTKAPVWKQNLYFGCRYRLLELWEDIMEVPALPRRTFSWRKKQKCWIGYGDSDVHQLIFKRAIDSGGTFDISRSTASFAGFVTASSAEARHFRKTKRHYKSALAVASVWADFVIFCTEISKCNPTVTVHGHMYHEIGAHISLKGKNLDLHSYVFMTLTTQLNIGNTSTVYFAKTYSIDL